MSASPPLVMVGLHHRAVPLDVLERARPEEERGHLAPVLALGAAGAVGVVTCHRVELYLEGASPSEAERLFLHWRGGPLEGGGPLVVPGVAAARHLLRVAAGLEAAVLGDDQVLGQLRAAYRAACEARCAGPLLHRLFHAAFRAGKRVRSETGIGRGGRSLAGEGVAWLARCLGGLDGCSVLILGAGEMASIAARRLAKRGAGMIRVANRSPERAAALAAEVGGEPVPWGWREAVLESVDALVVGTSAGEPVVRPERLAAAATSRGRLLAVDLSVPRNLAVPDVQVPGLRVMDVEGLARLLERERERRAGAVRRAEEIVEEELGEWESWVAERRAGCTARRAGRSARAV